MTGTWQDFEIDGTITGFSLVIAKILLRNELDGTSNGYELIHSTGVSGYSFGGNQMDLSSGSGYGRTVLKDILIHAKGSNDDLIFPDGSQWYDDHQAAIESSGSSSALLGTEWDLINQALSSDYGKNAINAAFITELNSHIGHVNDIISSLENGNIKTTLQNSEELRACLVDYDNQYGINPTGPMADYLNGEEVTTYQNNVIQLDGMITLEDLRNFISQTLQATQQPSDYTRRQGNIDTVLDEFHIGKYLSGNSDGNHFTGSDFNDYIDGKGGIDTVNAGDGDDLVIYRAADNSPLFTSNEYLSGDDGDDTLRLMFKSSELTSALREEVLDVYYNMVVNNIGPYSHTFTNLKLEISNFENLEVFVDGKQVSLDPQAADNYYIGRQQGSGVSTEFSGQLLNTGFYSEPNQINSYVFKDGVTAVAGTYSTVEGGTIVISSTGTFAYTSSAGFVGQDSYTYTVTDSSGRTITGTDYFVSQQVASAYEGSYSPSEPMDYTGLGSRGPNAVYVVESHDDEGIFYEYYVNTACDDTVTGSAYADRIGTNDGSDTIYGGGGDDIISGGGDYQDGTNCLYNPVTTTSHLYGQDGNDTILVGDNTGSFYLSGGNGNDIISVDGLGTKYIVDQFGRAATFAATTTQVYGDDGNDRIYIDNPGSDSIYGGNGDDFVIIAVHHLASTSPSTFDRYGGVAYDNRQLSDTYDGGDGTDTLSFNYPSLYSDIGIKVNLNDHWASYDGAQHTILNFENVIGTTIDDNITGSVGDNVLDGNGGNDVISGGGGNDTIIWSKYYYGQTRFVDSTDEGTVTVHLKDVYASDLTAYSNGTNISVFVTAQSDGTTNTVPHPAVFYIQDDQHNVFFENPDGTLVDIHDIVQIVTGDVPNGGEVGQDTNTRSGENTTDNGTVPPPPPLISDSHVFFPQLNHIYAPLIIDMEGNGIQVSTLNTHAVYFDVLNGGTKAATSWVGPDDALLVMDRNNNGLIDNGSELFISREPANGFTSLAEIDSNSDGIINSTDTHFSELKIWIDANQDGVSQLNELQTLSQAGIQSISLNPTSSYQQFLSQYVLNQTSTVTMNDASTKTIGTGWLDFNLQNTLHPLPSPLNPIVKDLPNLRGYGELTDLDVQMSLDALLRSKVVDIHGMTKAQVLDPSQHFEEKFSDIMFQWDAGHRPSNWEYNSSNAIADARKFSFVQDISGASTFITMPSAYEISGFQSEGLWQKTLTYYEGNYLAQTAFRDLFANHSWFDVVKGIFTDIDQLSGSGLLTIENLISNSSDKAYSWSLVVRAVDAYVGMDDLSSSDYSMLDNAIQTSTDYTLSEMHDMVTGAPITIYGTTSGETLTGTFVDDIIHGVGGGGTMIGGAGDDTLYGGRNGNIFDGGSGDDIYNAANALNDDTYIYSSGHDLILSEVYGTDLISFVSGIALSDISMEVKNLTDSTNWDIYHQANLVIHVADHGDITVSSQFGYNSVQGIETLQFADSSTLDLIHLNDVVYGTSGNDTMTGVDRVYFLDDRLDAGDGNDILNGGLGHNYLDGGWGNDTYYVGQGVDVIHDGNGTDQIVFNNTFDPNLITFDFNQLMSPYDPTTEALKVYYDGQLKVVIDQEFGLSSTFIEKISVDGVHDFDIANMNWDQHGTNGNDTIYAMQSSAIDNAVYGMGGDDFIQAASFKNNTLYGGDGNDYLNGSDGNDHLYGNDGNDTLVGAYGSDLLQGGAGTDTLTGGSGSDTFVFGTAGAFSGVDTITDFNTGQNDKLDISDLLVGYTPGTSDIADFVSITTSGSNSQVFIDQDGAGTTYSSQQIATLSNVTGLDVHDLLTNGNLIAT